jgi:hypothetical protein
LKKTIFAISILLTFSLIFSASLLAGDQDKSKAKTTTAVQKIEGQDVKTNTDKCSHCAHKCKIHNAEKQANEKCDCENCDLTKGSAACKAKHAAGECKHVCKHDAEKNDPKNNEKK